MSQCGLFRDSVQFCSGLVDLVVGVGRHFGGGPSLALAGERFIGLVAEDLAEVGDRDGDFGDQVCGQWIDGKPGEWLSLVRSVRSRSRHAASQARLPRIVAVLPTFMMIASGHGGVSRAGRSARFSITSQTRAFLG